MKTAMWLKGAALAIGILVAVHPCAGQGHLPANGPEKNHAAPVQGHEVGSYFTEAENDEEEGKRVFFLAEYQLFKPRRRAHDIALLAPLNNGRPNGLVYSLDWETASGFRVGGGMHLPHNWQVGVYYSYIHASDEKFLGAPAGGTLFATLTNPSGPIEQVTSVNAGSNLNLNVMDIEFAKPWKVNENLNLRIDGGGRFAWLDQTLLAFYNGGDANLALVNAPIDFHGQGIRVGGEGTWKIYERFGFYASAHGSLLAGKFRSHLVETNNNGGSVVVNVVDKFNKVVPVTELGIGLAYQGELVRLRVGYQMANWFGMVDAVDFADDVHRGKPLYRTSDLSLDGLNLEVLVDF